MEKIHYWIATEPKRENIRLSLEAVLEMAEREDIHCIYFSLSKEKRELSEMLKKKQQEIMDSVEIIDTPGLNVEDLLYILGDVVDRGEHPIEALKILMTMPNCICLAGNHEVMPLSNLKLLLTEITEDFLDRLSVEELENLEDWMCYNGGKTTVEEFIRNMRKKVR